MRVVKIVLIAVAALAVAFVGTSWWVLESGGVAVIGTQTPEGGARSTHVWYVEPDGELWLEAGRPENGWFLDVQKSPAVEFESDGRTLRYIAQPVEGEPARSRIRSLIREKYGFRDRWVDLILDTSRTVAVRLIPGEI